MSADAVVVNYHTPHLIDLFLDSINGQFSQLVIVNNEATEQDRSAGERWSKIPNVAVINNKENLGYARAVNRAVDRLKHGTPHRTLAIFNSDVLVAENGLAHMDASLWENDDVVIAGPLQVDSSGRVTHAGIFGTLEKPRHRAWHQPVSDAVRDVRDDAVTVSGSAYFVKRFWWDEATGCPIYQNGVKEVIGCSAEGAFLPTMHYY